MTENKISKKQPQELNLYDPKKIQKTFEKI